MTVQRLTSLRATEFRSLAQADIPLAPLTVLVGPNGSGKTNVLNALRFLASTVRFDLPSTVEQWGGYHHVKRQGETHAERRVTLGISGLLTRHASINAPDDYDLTFGLTPKESLTRSEKFRFKRTQGRGRRIEISGTKAEITDDDYPAVEQQLATSQTTGLATLPRLADDQGGEGIRAVAEFLSGIRVLEPDVSEARRSSRLIRGNLADDASNLAAVLHRLAATDDEAFDALLSDMRFCLQGLDGIDFLPVGGPGSEVVVALRERGLRKPIELADASYGTVRLLALLTAVHEPDPPPFTAIEEVDHGLHPYALDVLIERFRAASEHTQLLLATHSPTLVNRLKPEELVLCSRESQTGASLIPALDTDQVRRAITDSGLDLGELWFAGSLGGVPELTG